MGSTGAANIPSEIVPSNAPPAAASQRSSDVPDGEGVEREVEQVLVKQVRRKKPPGFAPIEDQRRGFGSIDEQSGDRQRALHAARREQDPRAREEKGERYPRNTRNREQFAGGRWTRRGIVGCRGRDGGFFR